MTPEDIKDVKSLEAWLGALLADPDADRERVHRLAVAIGHRSAMRVLPIVLESLDSDKNFIRHMHGHNLRHQNLHDRTSFLRI